jgi:adenosylmethionine-8-amino-7-oxononanoate aminotransferase
MRRFRCTSVAASGAWLYDVDERPVLDAISSWWVTTHGHCHPDIVRAVTEQAASLDQVIFAGFTHEPAAALAAELVSRLPRGLSRIFFSDNGSTAVEVAIKMSLQSFANRGTPRRLVAALENAYHGGHLRRDVGGRARNLHASVRAAAVRSGAIARSIRRRHAGGA